MGLVEFRYYISFQTVSLRW